MKYVNNTIPFHQKNISSVTPTTENLHNLEWPQTAEFLWLLNVVMNQWKHLAKASDQKMKVMKLLIYIMVINMCYLGYSSGKMFERFRKFFLGKSKQKNQSFVFINCCRVFILQYDKDGCHTHSFERCCYLTETSKNQHWKSWESSSNKR